MKDPRIAYLFMDEIQLVDNFGTALKVIQAKHPNLDIYVTGSNSKTLSKDIEREIGTENSNEIVIHPLTFDEIVTDLPSYDFDQYSSYGGIPKVVLAKEEERDALLEGLFRNTYLKDIYDRNKDLNYIGDGEKRRILQNVFDTITTGVSLKSIARQINADNKSIDKNSTLIHSNVDSFIQRILDSFLFELLEEDACRSKESRKNAIERYGKYYCEDLGLLRTVSTSSELDAAAFENLVFLHLLHKQYKLRSLKFDFYDEIDHCVCKNRGIDFCFEKNNVPCFIQVTLALNSTNYNRETRNLLFSPKEGRRILVFSFDSTLSHPFGEKIEFMDISTFLANF